MNQGAKSKTKLYVENETQKWASSVLKETNKQSKATMSKSMHTNRTLMAMNQRNRQYIN